MRKNKNLALSIIFLIGILSLSISYSLETSIILNETAIFNGVEYNIIKMDESSDKKIIIKPLKANENKPLSVTEPQKISKDLKRTLDNYSEEGLVPVIITLKTQPAKNVSEKVKKKYEKSVKKSKSNVKRLYHKARLKAVAKTLGIKKANVSGNWKTENKFDDISSFLTSTEKQQIIKENTNYENIKKQMIQEIAIQTKSIIKPEQEKVKKRITELGGIVTGEGHFFNLIFAKVPAGKIDTLAQMPEVVGIDDVKIYKPLLDTSAYSIYAHTFWNNNYTGYPWDVAVVDTGIDSYHPAFSSIYVEGIDFVTNDCDGNNPDDNDGHGTHVAGIIASGDTTYRGIAPGAWLINVKAYTDDTCNSGGGWFTDTDIMQGIEWAINNSTYKAEIVSASLGGQVTSGETYLSRFFDAIVDDLDIIAVIAAGNSGNDCASPPCYGTVESPGISYNAITVGAVTDMGTTSRSDDSIAYYSSRGPVPGSSRIKPDIVAPGGEYLNDCIYSTSNTWEGTPLGFDNTWCDGDAPTSGYDFVGMQGTSMATPHISGAAALLMSAGVYDPKEIKALLINTAEDYGTPGGDYDYGWGYVDLSHAYFHTPDVRLGKVNTSQEYLFYKGFVYIGDKATLVWNRHAVYNGSNYPTTYYSLSDLDLRLYREIDGALLDASTSADENVEQVVSPSDATVVIKAEASSFANGITSEEFALATEEGISLASPPSLTAVVNTPSKIAPGNNFDVLVDVYNNGGVAAHNVAVSLSLPSGFSIVSGANPRNVGSIPAGSATTAIWTLTTSASEGNYTISASVTSTSYGETYSTSNSGTLSVDTTPPAIFIQLPENTTYTSSNVPLNVSANESISTWWYSLNGGLNITFTPNATITAAEGLNHLIVYANDTAGNIGVAERYFSVDTLPPKIIIHNPINGTTNSDVFNFTFSELTSWAAYSVNGRNNITIANVYNWSGILSNLTDGSHNITVYANDSFGHMNSTIRFWTRDTVQPTITIYSPKNTTYTYNNISLNVSADENIHTWWYNLNGTNITFTQNTTITADEGFNELVIYANDTAGNIGYTVQYFTVDTIPPIIRIISPQNKSYSTGEIDYNLTAEEALNWSVVSIDGGTNITLGKLNDTYFYNLSSQHQNLSEGAHNASFYAKDFAGNLNSSTVYFTVDVTPPAVGFLPPTPSNGSISTTHNITINVSHAEPYPDTLILSWNGTNISQPYSGSYTSLIRDNLTDGRYSYYAWVNDTAGNANATRVRVVTIDTLPPEVANITPANGTGVKGVVTISVIARDAGVGVASVVANVSNATYSEVLNLTYNGSNVWYNATWNTSALAEGEYNITINATDTIGRSNATYVTVIVDRTPPASQVLSPLPNENISTSSYLINGTAQDNGSGLARVWVSVDGGATWALANGTANWSYEWQIAGDGEYNITSRAEDKAGNNQTSLQNVTVTVDTTPPRLTLLPPTPGDSATLSTGTSSVTINISINETHPDTLILSWNGANQSLNYSSGYVNITKSVSSGNSYTFYVFANDTFGNANATPARTFSVASGGGGNGGGGGGGGGGALPCNVAEIEKVFKGSSAIATFDEECVPDIVKVTIHAALTHYYTTISVETYKTKPAWTAFPEPAREVYRYFRIEYKKPDTYIEKAEVVFRVSKAWLKEENINPSTVVMLRYAKRWEELETQPLGEDEGFFIYKAATPEFSYFAVAGEKGSGFRVKEEVKDIEGLAQIMSLLTKNETVEKTSEEGKEDKEETSGEEMNATGEAGPMEENVSEAEQEAGRGICGPTSVLLLSLLSVFLVRRVTTRPYR